MATNSHSVEYETLRFGHGPLVFLLYNFINKVHANIDTELCTRLNFFDLYTRQRPTATKKLNNISCGLSTSEGNLLTLFHRMQKSAGNYGNIQQGFYSLFIELNINSSMPRKLRVQALNSALSFQEVNDFIL